MFDILQPATLRSQNSLKVKGWATQQTEVFDKWGFTMKTQPNFHLIKQMFHLYIIKHTAIATLGPIPNCPRQGLGHKVKRYHHPLLTAPPHCSIPCRGG